MLALLLAPILSPAVARAAHDDESWLATRVQAPAGTAGTPVVKPDAAPVVVGALLPLREGDEVAAGWRLEAIALGRFVRLSLRARDEERRGEVGLYPADWLPGAACVAAGLGVTLEPTDLPVEVAQAVCVALADADVERLFAHVGAPAPRQARPGAPAPAWGAASVLARATHAAPLTQALFLGLLAALALALRRHARRALPALALPGAALATLAGLTWRLALPVTTLKEAYPFRGFDVIVRPWGGPPVPAELGFPVAQHAVTNLVWLLAPAGTGPEAVLGTLSAIMGGLTPLLLALALGLLGHARAGVAAAWLLALLPLHVKVSASEAVTVASGFYQAAALIGLALATRGASPRDRRGGLALLLPALWLLFLVRPENPLLAGVFLVGTVLLNRDSAGGRAIGASASRGLDRSAPEIPARALPAIRSRESSRHATTFGSSRTDRQNRPAEWPIWAVVGVALVPPLALVWQGGVAAGTAGNVIADLPRLAGRLLPPHHALMWPRVTPALLPLLVGVGLGALAWRDRRLLATLLAGLLPLTAMYMAIVSDVIPFGEIRYQANLAPLWCALGGAGVASLCGLPGVARRPGWALAGVLALWAGWAGSYASFVRDQSYNPQADLRFLVEQVRPRVQADPPCPVLLVPSGDERYKDEDAAGIAALVDPQRRLRVARPADLRRLHDEEAPACALFVRGLFCARAHAPDEQENRECRRILARLGVTPIIERDLPNRPYHRERAPLLGDRPSLRFGLYRVPLP